MNFFDFIKDKFWNIFLIIFVLLTIEVFLIIYNFGTFVKIYIFISVLFVYFISLFIEFLSKRRFYNNILKRIEELDQKYLITEIIKKSDFLEGNLLLEILKDVNKSMIENVNYYKHLQEEYKEYIELWIHEVKIPIASSKLITENNRNEVTKSINEDLDRIDDYVEQALFYARSNTVEKDYIIRKVNLKDIVNTVIKKNKSQLLSANIKIETIDIENEVYIDSKWISFILNQIISNSIKYSKSTDAKIEIFSKEFNDKVILYIKDNGIGIKSGELDKVFEKGFTGSNGRMIGKKSTGIGLYLCKKLCDKLGIGIVLSSVENKETEVKIIFPKGSFTDFD